MTNKTLLRCTKPYIKRVLQNCVCFLIIVSLEKDSSVALYHLPAFCSSGVLHNTVWVTKCDDDDSNKIYSFTNFLLKARRAHLLCWKGLSAGTSQVAFAGHSPLWRDTSVCIHTWDTTDATYIVLTSSGMQGSRWTRITVRCMRLELAEDCKMFQFF